MNDRVFTVAAYIRLSSEDKDLDERKIESESVSNQREYIKEYINNDSELSGAKYMEFVDDGYSGLDFHRPNFNEMIKRAMNGDIDCIIVKDFSRFARNHIETGNFLEQVFPFINVRFISINDHYDSKFADNTPGIDIGFRNILYEYYSMDLSKKVKKAREMAAKSGFYGGGPITYGYKFAKDKGNNLQVNEETAPIVKRIFKMKLDGLGTTKIAKILNDEGVPSPGAYENRNSRYSQNILFWAKNSIERILKNETYIGNLISHKSETYRTPDGIKIRKAIPIIAENAHEPIIDKETFYAVNSKKKIKRKNIHTWNKSLFSGKIKCGECGRYYKYSYSKHVRYFCSTPATLTSARCYRKRFSEDYLADYVLRELKIKINNVGLSEKLEKQVNNSTYKDYKKIKMSLKNKIERIKARKFDLFEQFANKTISEKTYLIKNSEYERDINAVRDELSCVEAEEIKNAVSEDLPKNDELKDITKLSRDILDKVINYIIIDGNGNIDIEWKF